MQISSLGKGGLRRGSSQGLASRPLHAYHAPVQRYLRKAAVVVCAAPSKQEPESKTKSSMPRLPPRNKPQQPASPTTPADQSPPRPKSSSNSSRFRPKPLGSFAGGPNQPPPSESPQSVMQEKALAGLLAYTGLMGTAATAIAFFTPGLDLFGGIHWDVADVSLALKLMLPVYGLNLLILLPNYSSWKVPEVTAESQAAMVEAIAKWSARKGSKGNSSSASSSSSTSTGEGGAEQTDAAAAGDVAAAAAAAAASGSVEPAAEAAAAPHAAAEPGVMPQPSMQAADVRPSAVAATADAAPASSSTAGTEASTAAGTPAPIASSDIFSSSSEAEDSWLSRQLRSPSIMRMRDALYMAQGHYLSINPAVVLPLPLQAIVLLADCLAAELLYRSVALQLAGGWIGDRMVEAGADDVLESLLAGMPVLSTHASGQLVAVALLSAASGVVVLRNMRRMARRPQQVLGAQGRQAAGQLLTDLQDRHRRQQRQQQQQQQQNKDASNSSSSSSDASSSSSSNSTAASQPDDKASSSSTAQQQQSASRAAADWAVAAAKAAAGTPQQQQQGGPPPDPQWSRRIPSTLSGLALSQLVQGARDIGQMTALGLSFVLTGNLAAPFAAAVVNQALMAALQKRGLERARQRSIAMAKHLAGITRQLRDAQRKQEEKKRQQQQGEQQQLTVSADAVQDAKAATTAADGAPSSGSDTASVAAAAAVTAQDAAASSGHAPVAAAAAASPALDSTAVRAATAAAHNAADTAAAAAPLEAAPAGEALVASRMERTINVLDQLLGQLGEHATAGPGPGK